MVFQVIPRELAFYGLFERLADTVALGAEELLVLVDDLPNAAAHSQRIQELEHEGDEITHAIMSLLNTTFVVPFDRGDIHELASRLDDLLDGQEAVADYMVLYGFTEVLPEVRLQAETAVTTTKVVAKLMRNLQALLGRERLWRDIIRLEREGDLIYRLGVAKLYGGDFTAMEVLKWKDILDQMEAGIDHCEDIANATESIALLQA